MSLILDALRRADREREREHGGVPSLHSPAPPPWTPAAERAADDQPRPWLWLAAGLGGGLVLAAVWALWSATPTSGPASTAEPPPPVAQGPAAPPPPARTEPRAVQRTETARIEPPARAPIERARPDLPEARSQQARTPPPAAPRAQAAEADRKPPRDEPERASPSAAAAPSRRDEAKADAAERPAAIRQLGELPADVRSQLPALTIGGAMYSSKAANRRLIVNGQLLSEGDAVAPGLVLEEIRLKSAVLRWRDLRYEQGF